MSKAMEAPLTRRELFLLGTGGVLSVALAQLQLHGAQASLPALSLEGVREQVIAPLSVGFWSDDDDSPVLDAALLPAGDTRFVTEGARLRILGLYPRDAAALAGIDALDLDVPFAAHPDASFSAWSFRNGTTQQHSSPVSFPVPLDAAEGVNLSLSWRAAGSTETQQALIRLAAGQETGVAKLRAGTYVVDLPQADASLPDWVNQRVESVARGLRTLQRYERVLGVHVPVERPHLLLTVS
jgi:hypothetical protein